MTKSERAVLRAAWVEVDYHREWKYVESATDKILGGVSRHYNNEYAAYMRGQPSGIPLGDFTTERGAKVAVEQAFARTRKGR